MAVEKHNFHVTGIPRVNVRCQFKSIPGVTHIVLEFDPYSRGNQVAGKIECAYGDFPLNDQIISSALSNQQAGSLFIIKKEAFVEIAEAIKGGMDILSKMVKASGYVPGPF